MDTSIITGLISSVAMITGKLMDIAKTSKNTDLSSAIIEFQQKIIEMQPVIYDLQEENQQLKNEIAKLNDNKKMEDDFEYPTGQSYIIHKKENRQIKICTTCWHNGHKYHVLSEINGRILCSDCDTFYE